MRRISTFTCRKPKQKRFSSCSIILSKYSHTFSPSKIVQQEPAEYYELYKKRNKEYAEFEEKNAGGNENLQPRSAQTFNVDVKHKKVRTDEIMSVAKETICTTWDLYDTTNRKDPDFYERIQGDM